MPSIERIIAREILDSRGYPTVEAEVTLCCGVVGIADAPSGASTGSFEALELRDGGSRLMGKGVRTAVSNVNNIIAPALAGIDATRQSYIDNIMVKLDGTDNKSKLGANAILPVSLAVCRAAASYYDIPLYRYIGGLRGCRLPKPMMNILNGGAHADNKIDIQEFMVVPAKESSFTEYVTICTTVYHTLRSLLKSKGLNSNVGDEGGVAPNLSSTSEALDVIMEAISGAGYIPGDDVQIAIDAAASEFYDGEKYYMDGSTYTSEQLVGVYKQFSKDYPIISIEDPLAEEDWNGFSAITRELGKKEQIVGDDIFVTNNKRLQEGIKVGAANAILIKLNQIGTVSETLTTINTAQSNGYNVVISHRSGETCDTSIADLAVAVGAQYIKTGAPARGERVTKYNRLLRIEEDLYGRQ
ncbi:MAG: phosphopyruvate hydratase [Holosporales bacterium]|jgi:enolase|nr:phosphopyruvate hydratase [Holosporales bacterium]